MMSNFIIYSRDQRRPNNHVVNNTPMGTNLNTFSIQSLSDSKLLELANHYITTDESLEKFQARLREKYKNIREDRDSYAKEIDMVRKEKLKITKSLTDNGVMDNINESFKGGSHTLPGGREQNMVQSSKNKKGVPNKNIMTS
jgi:hypothetical protein